MKRTVKSIFLLLTCVCAMLLLNACGTKMTLDFAAGPREGTYTGDMENGLPNGQGKFTSQNTEGTKWTYEGGWKNGRFDGAGTTTFSDGSIETATYVDGVAVPLKGDEIASLNSSPDSLKGQIVEVTGKVISDTQRIEDATFFIMFADPVNNTRDVTVYTNLIDYDATPQSYVTVVGRVLGADPVSGQPVLLAQDIETMSYQDAVSPTLEEVDVGDTQTQLGYSVTVQKVEFAENETRIYMMAANSGSATFSLGIYDAKVIQDGKQYGVQQNYEAQYPELQYEVLPGASTEGVLAFPGLEIGAFQLVMDAYSQDYEEQLEPFTFDIAV